MSFKQKSFFCFIVKSKTQNFVIGQDIFFLNCQFYEWIRKKDLNLTYGSGTKY